MQTHEQYWGVCWNASMNWARVMDDERRLGCSLMGTKRSNNGFSIFPFNFSLEVEEDLQDEELFRMQRLYDEYVIP